MKKITASQLDNLSCLFTYQPTSTKFFCIPYKTKDWNVRTVDQTENSIKHHKRISFFKHICRGQTTACKAKIFGLSK